jgi:hypothetical protein
MSLKGKINKWMGVATGDRDQEARGEFQEETGQDPSQAEQAEAKRAVKAQHHDYGDRTPPQRVAHVDRAPTPRSVHRPRRAG